LTRIMYLRTPVLRSDITLFSLEEEYDKTPGAQEPIVYLEGIVRDRREELGGRGHSASEMDGKAVGREMPKEGLRG